MLPELTARVEWITGDAIVVGLQDITLVDRVPHASFSHRLTPSVLQPLLVGDTVARLKDVSQRGMVIKSECYVDVRFLQVASTI